MATLIFFLVLSILIIVHEFGHFAAAKALGVRVERFSLGFGKALLKFKRNETEYCISAVPLGGYIKMAGDEPTERRSGARHEFLSRGVGDRFWVIFAGPFLNYSMALLLFWVIFAIGNPTMTAKVGGVLEGFPAQASGIQKDDRIIAVDGKAVQYWEEVTDVIHNRFQGSVELKVLRGDKELNFVVTPKVREVKNILGQEIRLAQVGVAPAGEIVRVKYPLKKAIFLGTKKMLAFTALTYQAIWRIVTGGLPLRESLTGPVGIFFMTKEASQMGFVYLLQIVALLSASLAIFNLLPIPVLDGGHVIFLFLEKIRKRPLSPKVNEAITNAAVYLLVFLGIIVIYNDLIKFGVLKKLMGLIRR